MGFSFASLIEGCIIILVNNYSKFKKMKRFFIGAVLVLMLAFAGVSVSAQSAPSGGGGGGGSISIASMNIAQLQALLQQLIAQLNVLIAAQQNNSGLTLTATRDPYGEVNIKAVVDPKKLNPVSVKLLTNCPPSVYAYWGESGKDLCNNAVEMDFAGIVTYKKVLKFNNYSGSDQTVNFKVVVSGKPAGAEASTSVLIPSNTVNQAVQPIIIKNVQYSPASPKVYDQITTSVTILNDSSKNYDKPFKVVVQGTAVIVPSLGAGVQKVVTVPNAFTFSFPGTQTLNTVIVYPLDTDPGSGMSGNVFTNTLTFASGTTQPSITVLSPNGGETLGAGKTFLAKWTSSNLGNLTISIDLISKAGYPVRLASSITNTGSYQIQLPPDLKDGYYKLQVSTNDKGPSASDDSDEYFMTVNGPSTPSSITVVSPNGGETLLMGQKYKIDWESKGLGLFDIVLDARWERGGPDIVIAKGVREHSFIWTVPSNLISSDVPYPTGQTSEQYKILVVDGNGTKELIGDYSDNYFTITSPVTPPTKPSIYISSPTGAETWKVGETHRIAWKASSVDTVDLSIYSDPSVPGAGNTSSIANGVSASKGYFDWTIPQTIPQGKTYRIRINDPSKPYGEVTKDSERIAINSFTPEIPPITIPEVITPVATSISPASGPAGTKVTINGSGFTATGNTIVLSGIADWVKNISSTNGTSVTFTIPKYYPNSTSGGVSIQGSLVKIGDTLTLSVKNANGVTAKKIFRVQTTVAEEDKLTSIANVLEAIKEMLRNI